MRSRLAIDQFHSGSTTHPAEDAYGYATDAAGGVFAVFDGVTLAHYDPYPNPSPAAVAARVAVDTIIAGYQDCRSRGTAVGEAALRELIAGANATIRTYNTEIGTTPATVDFLRRQYAAAVGAVAVVDGNRLYAAQINDTELSVLDAAGERVYRLSSDKRAFYDYLEHLEHTGKLAVGTPEEHRYVREQLVNHEDVTFAGRPARSGVLTGEPVAEHFITSGGFELKPGLALIVYSDGYLPLLERADFRQTAATGTTEDVEQAVARLEATGHDYQSEKSLVRVRMLESPV